MNEDVVGPIFFFSTVLICFVTWLYFKQRARADTHQTIRLAMERGQDLSPDIIKQIAEPEPSKDRDLRRALVFLGLAMGLVLCGFAVPDPDALRGLLAGASFPFSIGVAFLIMWWYGGRKEA